MPVIILSGRSNVADKVYLLRRGANDYLVKPFEFDDLLMREISEARCGLPPGSDAAKVRRGGVGGYRSELPPEVAAAIDAKWTELAAPATGHADYAGFEAAVRARAG